MTVFATTGSTSSGAGCKSIRSVPTFSSVAIGRVYFCPVKRWGLNMGCGVRRLVACLVCIGAGFAISPVTALGASSSSAEGTGASSLSGSLVTPGSPAQSEQAQAAEQAKLASPEALAAREESQTKYDGLDPSQAAKLAGEVFPDTIDRPAGAVPQLPAGQQVVGYPADNAAQVDLGGGKHGVIESMEPIAVETSPGSREPVDLSLDEANGAFQPKRSPVGLRIPKRLVDGVQLAGTGVSLTPVDSSGSALGGSEGTVDGATVLYANTQTDADTIVKPLALGFEEDTLLRSAESPEQLSYRVGLPVGGSLVQAAHGSGVVEVMDEGAVIATILPPSAKDAAGTTVPVSLSLSGDTLTLTVDHHAGEYQFPIEVDPTVTDRQVTSWECNSSEIGNWTYEHVGSGYYSVDQEYASCESKGIKDEPGYLTDQLYIEGGEYAVWGYATLGESHIYGFIAETSGTGEHVENELGIVNPSKTKEAHVVYPASYANTRTELCAEAGCATGTVTSTNEGNVAYFEQAGIGSTRATATGTFSAGDVEILQEKGPSVPTFNVSSPTLNDGQPNILYTHEWLGPHTAGGFEATAADPGTGINEWLPSSPNASEWGKKVKGDCTIECLSEGTTTAPLTMEFDWSGFGSQWDGGAYVEHYLPDGEDTVEVKVSDAVGLSAKAAVKIKVDQTPPHNITLAGLPPNDEIGNGEYHLKASATDGSGSTPSSGVASLVLKVDGKQVGSPAGTCSPGPCTATGEWLVSGSEFAVGQHEVTVTATDNAGNVAVETFTMYVERPTTPVAMGPGSVNLQSGEFSLGSKDVSIGALGAALTVARSYGSLHTTAGAEGPLGPQWVLSLGGSESLTKLPDGDMLLTDGTGLQAVYASKGKGEFTPPTGDESLVLSEKKVGEKVEFALKDSSGAVTTFTQSSGGSTSVWWPTVREEANGLDTTTTIYQVSGSITEPTEVIAPIPTGVSCGTKPEELKKGCRALQFVYSSKTTATGNGQSEWGNYAGRLQEVTFTAWEASKMVTKAVAQYQYDGQGRLRAEWDPLITPALKTTYGYDSAGRVTAVSEPGQQPWFLTYGTISGDARGGRLIGVTRPSASTASGDGTVPTNTTAPTLSTTKPVYGTALSVTSGSWSNSPLSYEYQWEDCNPIECKPILGATNPSYSPVSADKGYELAVKVTATNADGSTVVASNKSIASVYAPTYERTREFGKEGTGEGDLKKPAGVAVDSKGDVYVADTGNDRIVEFSATGVFMRANGHEGTGNAEFKEPKSITIDKEGYMFIADAGNDRIEILNSRGEYVTSIKTTVAPGAIALGEGEYRKIKVDALYVTFPSTNEVMKYVEYREDRLEHTQVWKFGKAGSGNGDFNDPTGVALNEAGSLAYVTDAGNHRVQVLDVNTASEEEGRDEVNYVSQFGESGSGNGEFSSPGGIAIEPAALEGLSEDDPDVVGLSGGTLVADPGDSRWQQFNSSHAYQQQYSEKEVQGMAINDVAGKGAGTVYAVNSTTAGKDKITEWAPKPWSSSPPEPPSPGTSAVTTIEYDVPISGTSAPDALGSSEVSKWGQTDDPVEATAIFPPDEPEGWPAQNYRRASIYYLDAKGRTVNIASPSGGISTTEYNTTDDRVRTLTPDDRAAALKEGGKSAEIAKLLATESTYNSEGTELLSTLGPQHKIKLANGSEVEARNHEQYSYDEGAPAEGGPYLLVTKLTDGAQYSGKEEDIRTTTTSYSGQENLGWKLHKPTSVTSDPSGLKLVHTLVYEAGTGNLTETRMPASPGAKSPHDEQTIYYTAGASTEYPTCGEHPEWANLPCQTQAGAQPKDTSLPPLAVSTDTYNLWDEPEKMISTSGSATRTTTIAYDAAGRTVSTETTSTTGTALPKVSDEYSTETGAPIKQSTTAESIKSVFNTLGQLTSYTDADENTATYKYDIDGRLEEANDGKGTQTYTYNTTTGFLAKLADSAAGTFTGTYDVEGRLLTEGYPNGMNANYSYNQTGEATGLAYEKTTDCTVKCVWFSESDASSIHGQELSQANTVEGETSTNNYTFDAAGRLTQAQETPAGKGCKTRVYAYEEDTNRTSLTSREPGTEGKCATEGGTVEKHTYDEADRLTDEGIAYDAFGDITTLPAKDAGGQALTSTYYTDSQLASQTQNGETIGYTLDPARRTRETVATGKTAQDIIEHYANSGDSPAWSIEPASGHWTRDIQGIGGALVAIQTNGETPVLQLSNLHGDIIATAALSETETKLRSSSTMTEYGVPTTTTPAKYSWLGSDELATELPSGTIDMGARSYVPQLGRFLQADPIPGGSANAYAYVFGDPVDESDPAGTSGLPLWFIAFAQENAQQIAEAAAARELAARIAAEEAAREAQEAAEAAAAAAAAPPPEAPQEPLGGSASWACEYALETGQEDPGCLGTISLGSGAAEIGGEATAASFGSLFSEALNSGVLHTIKQAVNLAGEIVHKLFPHKTVEIVSKCAGGIGSYGFVGKFVDAVDFTPEGAMASCAIGVLPG
jgi:RHS repeat-associated protein